MSEFDLDDREFSETKKQGTPFVPRAAAKYLIQPTTYENYEGDTRVGWALTFKILEAEATKKDPMFDMIAQPGATHYMTFCRIQPDAWKKVPDMHAMRTFLAAMVKEAHTPEFKATEPRDKLLQISKLGRLSELPPIVLVRDAWISKPNPEGKRFVNHRDEFSFVPA